MFTPRSNLNDVYTVYLKSKSVNMFVPASREFHPEFPISNMHFQKRGAIIPKQRVAKISK